MIMTVWQLQSQQTVSKLQQRIEDAVQVDNANENI